MKRFSIALAILAAAICLGIPAGAAAVDLSEPEKYKIETLEATLSDTQAGAHADFTTSFDLSEKDSFPYALTREVVVTLPPGVVGNPEAFPKCTTLEFGTTPESNECPFDSQIGSTDIRLGAGLFKNEPIYNMPAPGGDIVARFGFYGGIYPVILNVRLDPATDALVASAEGLPAAAGFSGSSSTFWGVPASSIHDPERITPLEARDNKGPPGGRKSNLPETPFMTNPTNCGPPGEITVLARSYALPDAPSSKTAQFPQITGCGALEFNPAPKVAPSTTQGTTGSGLTYELEFPTKGLEFGNLNSSSQMKRAEVVLPEGMSVNPSEAEGLGVCSEEDFARETYKSGPNVGCPETSKIGSVSAETPVIDRNPSGSLYLAKPYDNPFGSLLALYMVLKIPDRGVLVTLAGKVTTDPDTGQITTVFDDIPQLPVKSFELHFREGARAPLVTPPACGTYTTLSILTPWSAPGKPVSKQGDFSIDSGPSRGPCPTGGLPPFHPGLIAGSINNAAGTYSPFNVRLTRTDAEQEITHFSIKLPPGLVGKLAGIPFCSDAAIEAAKARKGIHGGEEELVAPSCPAASEIGSTLAGAGVGDVLVYVPGKVYLAGPYRGSALSIVAITAAKAGPFDLGTVVVREALSVNPETAEVFVDATGSDPIPHIVQGVPVRLKDIRVYVDRPEFTLNPTDCTRTSTASTVLGAGLDFVSEADNNPVTVTTPFQAADCGALGFKPKLRLRLIGGTKRGANPKFQAVLTARKGDANIDQAEVTLPHSEFIDNEHIGTVCTRVQFAAGEVPGEQCPKASIYGYAKAITPLLDEPVQGPVFLRSSSHPLPDLVAALHSGKIDINLSGRIDSIRNGRMRTTFEDLPDAPVTKFTLTMLGGKKGLLENSANLCKGSHRAIVSFTGQNGKVAGSGTELKAQCGKKSKRSRRAHDRAR